MITSRSCSRFAHNIGHYYQFFSRTNISLFQPWETFFCQFVSVQALCGYQRMFMDIHCHRPGSLHGAKIFANSKLNTKIKSNQIRTFYYTFSHTSYSLAYSPTPYCIKKYFHCTNNDQVIFNNLLMGARAETDLGLLQHPRWSALWQ